MPKRFGTKNDLSPTVFAVIQQVAAAAPEITKNPAAVASGKFGGRKGEQALLASQQLKAKAAQTRRNKK